MTNVLDKSYPVTHRQIWVAMAFAHLFNTNWFAAISTLILTAGLWLHGVYVKRKAQDS
jgi:uncharacterized membrane protein YjjP (DUF1212 family)